MPDKPKRKPSLKKISNEDVYYGENQRTQATAMDYTSMGTGLSGKDSGDNSSTLQQSSASVPGSSPSAFTQMALDRIPTPKLKFSSPGEGTAANQGATSSSQKTDATTPTGQGGVQVYGGSFSEAFARARKDSGREGQFVWAGNGKTYHTGWSGEKTKFAPDGASQKPPAKGADSALDIIKRNKQFTQGIDPSSLNKNKGSSLPSEGASPKSGDEKTPWTNVKSFMKEYPHGNLGMKMIPLVAENAGAMGSTAAATIGRIHPLGAGIAWTAGNLMGEADRYFSGQPNRGVAELTADAAATAMIGSRGKVGKINMPKVNTSGIKMPRLKGKSSAPAPSSSSSSSKVTPKKTSSEKKPGKPKLKAKEKI